MLFDQPTRAVIHLEDKPTEATTLKRLALIFDEVHFVPPGGTTIREESLDDPSRFDRRDDGRLIIKDFNYFRDTSSGYRLMSLNPALDDTISALEESGVAVDATDNAWKSDEEQKYKDIRSLLISQAVEDDTWNVLTDTSPEDYDLRTTVKAVEVENLSTKQLHTLWWVQEPPAVHLTDAIASTSYFASRTSAIPLFNSGLGPMLEHQYRQFKAGIARLRELDPAFRGLDNFDAQFGEASFFVANTVFSSATLEKSSVEEIILYRNEMALARQEFVSKDLTELAALIEDNPWGARSRDELNQYVRGKLAGDVAQFGLVRSAYGKRCMAH